MYLFLKFAKINCYAAEELGNIYYWGKTFVIGENNYFEIESNYDTAAKWYMQAVKNSNPPLQSACWSLSYTLTNIHYDTAEKEKEAETKAIEYLKLAGEYPAAYNRIVNFMFRDAEKLYQQSPNKISDYHDVITQFIAAIRLADRAGKMHWFYGNNQIALFLMEHKNDKELLNYLNKHLTLHVPFDLESQLKYSASYQNPWALKHLALFYLNSNRKKEAKQTLKNALAANYNAAFYEMAKYFYKRKSKKWYELMIKASELSYPPATYELAKEEKNAFKKTQLISLCRQQILSKKQLNISLLNDINTMEND